MLKDVEAQDRAKALGNQYIQCCFNHTISLPVKGNIERPLYPYQKTVLDALDKSKYVWILKSVGLGISELFLRYMAWLCLRDNQYRGSQFVVVTGPRVDVAKTLIDRMKLLFDNVGITFNIKDTVIKLNGTRIEAFPSHYIDAIRGLANVKFILVDEADFFPVNQQHEVSIEIKRYISKSEPYMILLASGLSSLICIIRESQIKR
jgi:late competence protein required for DNA uptake (superfamily II DNA/RNA helicase)